MFIGIWQNFAAWVSQIELHSKVLEYCFTEHMQNNININYKL